MRGELTRRQILDALSETRLEYAEKLWRKADAVRREKVGDAIHLRGLIEFSNRCSRRCLYCGLAAGRGEIERYRMTSTEIINAALVGVRYGFGTVVLQGGEDHDMDPDWFADLIRAIKAMTPMAVTVSVGEWPTEAYALWRAAGADRVLLRFETSNPDLFRRIHPAAPNRTGRRIELLPRLRDMGYQIGSGVMVGLPTQTVEDLASDVEIFRELDLDMIGIGPYMPHPDTPLGVALKRAPTDVLWSPARREYVTYTMVALARLACPEANIPSTSALATANRSKGRERGLTCGANVVMPNLTPLEYRRRYEIYPDKACIGEEAETCTMCLTARIHAIGRTVGTGRGDRLRAETVVEHASGAPATAL